MLKPGIKVLPLSLHSMPEHQGPPKNNPRRDQHRPAPSPAVDRNTRRLFGRWVLRWFLLISITTALGLILYALYLDHQVSDRFARHRWSLPANVYARPLELYSGKRLTAETLNEELARLGYSATPVPSFPGSYRHTAGEYLLHTREFAFWDSREAAHLVRLRIDHGQIVLLVDAKSNGALDLLRLDSALIGKILPNQREDRILVSYDQLPQLVLRTLLEVEDRRFLEHHGIDPLGILRAFWHNLLAGSVVEGGSTLTQQLVKNFYLNHERTLMRKVNEALIAIILDWRYSKQQILEAYVNEIYLAQDGSRAIHGFGLGSYFYFNRPLENLQPHEVALLIGMVKGPSYYDPRRNPERALTRRNTILDLLGERGVISAEAASKAKEQPLGVGVKGGTPSGFYPAFMELVQQQLSQDYHENDLKTEGLRIFTTLDPVLQTRAEQALPSRLGRLEQQLHLPDDKLQGAVVVIDQHQGEVLALVGDRNPRTTGYNRALAAQRPIGSLVKPWLYLYALTQPRRFHLASTLEDRPITLKSGGDVWKPKNYDGRAHGAVPLYESLMQSYNLATVDLGLKLGVKPVAEFINQLLPGAAAEPLPSTFLGSLQLTPIQVAQGYQVFATGGFRSPLHGIRAVLDSSGQPLKRYPFEVQQVTSAAPVFLLNWAMQRVVQEGTAKSLGKSLKKGTWAAGKTGTTNQLRDSWFAGYGADRLAVVWVGRDDNEVAGLSGAKGALPIWMDIMTPELTEQASQPQPIEVEWQAIHTASDCSGERSSLPFVKGNVPDESTCREATAIPPVIWDATEPAHPQALEPVREPVKPPSREPVAVPPSQPNVLDRLLRLLND